MRFPYLAAILRRFGVEPSGLAESYLDLPLLLHYGRSDATVAFYGANIGPADVQEAVFSIPELADAVSSFLIVTGEDDDANKTLRFEFELAAGKDAPAADLGPAVHVRLSAVNQDYREASRFIPSGREPSVRFHPAGTGPFEGHDIRLKRTYIKRD